MIPTPPDVPGLFRQLRDRLPFAEADGPTLAAEPLAALGNVYLRACVLGSIVASAIDSGGGARAVRLELAPHFGIGIVVPDFVLPTREARAVLWEERLKTSADALGVALDRLPERKSTPEKVRLAALMKAATSVSNGSTRKRASKTRCWSASGSD